MTDYITLLGAEDVSSAARTISAAADRMTNAAIEFGAAVDRFNNIVSDALARLDRPDKPIEKPIDCSTMTIPPDTVVYCAHDNARCPTPGDCWPSGGCRRRKGD